MPPKPAEQPALADDSPAPGEPDAAPSSPPVVDPDRAPVNSPDRRPSFAEVAEAVDVVTGRPAPASPFSEDLLPQRLPKRGRRSSRLETPWIRERPVAGTPESPVAPPAPAPSVADAPTPSRNGVDESPVGPAAAAATSDEAPQSDSAPAPSARGGERFAFFAAFRAAAEQAREEAGIDDRRRH